MTEKEILAIKSYNEQARDSGMQPYVETHEQIIELCDYALMRQAKTTTPNPAPIKARIIFQTPCGPPMENGKVPVRTMSEEIELDRFWMGWDCAGIEFLPKDKREEQ